MSESPPPKYLVRDPQGNVFGPADADMLRRWVAEGRIVPGMSIAAQGTGEWTEASVHPITRDLLQERLRQVMESQSPVYKTPQSTTTIDPSAPQPDLAQGTVIIQSTVTRTETVIPYGPPPPRQNLLATGSLAAGVLSLLTAFPSLCFCFAFCFAPASSLFALAAVTMGAMGVWQIKNAPDRYKGRGMAITGLTMGVLMLLGYLTIILVTVIRSLSTT